MFLDSQMQNVVLKREASHAQCDDLFFLKKIFIPLSALAVTLG